MRVLLADDQVWLRSAIRLLLQEAANINQIDEAGDLRTLVARAQQNRPGLILVDWELPGLRVPDAGHELVTALRAVCPEAMIVVLSGRPEASRAAREAGVDGFVSKADPPETLLAMVQQATIFRAGGQSVTPDPATHHPPASGAPDTEPRTPE